MLNLKSELIKIVKKKKNPLFIYKENNILIVKHDKTGMVY